VAPQGSDRTTFARAVPVAFVSLSALLVAFLVWDGTEKRPTPPPPPEPVGDLKIGELPPNEHPMNDDLKRGRWKAGDSVADVEACYKAQAAQTNARTVHGVQRGEYTVLIEYVVIFGKLDEYSEVIAYRGRLKSAVSRQLPGPPFDFGPPRVFFDTFTEEEWASYYASQALDSKSEFGRQNWANSRYGVLWLNRALFGVAGRLRVLKW